MEDLAEDVMEVLVMEELCVEVVDELHVILKSIGALSMGLFESSGHVYLL